MHFSLRLYANAPRAPKKRRVTYCARTSPLPLLPSGPGGVGGITSRRTRHLLILSPQPSPSDTRKPAPVSRLQRPPRSPHSQVSHSASLNQNIARSLPIVQNGRRFSGPAKGSIQSRQKMIDPPLNCHPERSVAKSKDLHLLFAFASAPTTNHPAEDPAPWNNTRTSTAIPTRTPFPPPPTVTPPTTPSPPAETFSG